jgi:rubrerythrin
MQIDPPRCDWSVMPFKDRRRGAIWRCRSCGHSARGKHEPPCPCKVIEVQ